MKLIRRTHRVASGKQDCELVGDARELGADNGAMRDSFAQAYDPGDDRARVAGLRHPERQAGLGRASCPAAGSERAGSESTPPRRRLPSDHSTGMEPNERRIVRKLIIAAAMALLLIPAAASAAPGDVNYEVDNGSSWTLSSTSPLATVAPVGYADAGVVVDIGPADTFNGISFNGTANVSDNIWIGDGPMAYTPGGPHDFVTDSVDFSYGPDNHDGTYTIWTGLHPGTYTPAQIRSTFAGNEVYAWVGVVTNGTNITGAITSVGGYNVPAKLSILSNGSSLDVAAQAVNLTGAQGPQGDTGSQGAVGPSSANVVGPAGAPGATTTAAESRLLRGDTLRVLHAPVRRGERLLSVRAWLITATGLKRLAVQGKAIKVDLRGKDVGNYNVILKGKYVRKSSGTVHTVRTERNLSVTLVKP